MTLNANSRANCASKVQHFNSLASLTKHSSMSSDCSPFHKLPFGLQSFNSDSNWVTLALKSSGKQGLLLWESEGCFFASKLWKLHMREHAIFLGNMCISHLFSLGSALASIKMTTHLIRVQDKEHKILIYIHPHTHYFHYAILPSNYRKIHCLLLLEELCRSLQADGENTAYEQLGSVSGPLSLYPEM